MAIFLICIRIIDVSTRKRYVFNQERAKQIAHSEQDVRAAYNYADYLPERRKMMQEWADYLDDLKQK
ncbi:MAG: hypothetical protein LBI10_02345 [Deltaproteobacteria bacterium]|jgi:hypothetical protein|nr:hypothetical protein [Deltaproteobacteria bacterium]